MQQPSFNAALLVWITIPTCAAKKTIIVVEITASKFAHNCTTSIQSQKVLNADKSTHAHQKMLNDNKNMDVHNQRNILLLGKVESCQA